jgi:hypothetical protein
VTPPRTGGAEKNIAIFATRLAVTGANSGLPEFGTLSRPKSDKSDFGWARARKAAPWILAERGHMAEAPTCGCRKRSPVPLHCFRIVIYNERRKCRAVSARSADIPHPWAVLGYARSGVPEGCRGRANQPTKSAAASSESVAVDASRLARTGTGGPAPPVLGQTALEERRCTC